MRRRYGTAPFTRSRVTGSRRARRSAAALVRYATLFRGGAPATVADAKVELRRARLAQKGRELFNIVACPWGCDRADIMKKQLRFHCKYACARRFTECRQCGKRLQVSKLKDHVALDCPVVLARSKLVRQVRRRGVDIDPSPRVVCGSTSRLLCCSRVSRLERIERQPATIERVAPRALGRARLAPSRPPRAGALEEKRACECHGESTHLREPARAQRLLRVLVVSSPAQCLVTAAARRRRRRPRPPALSHPPRAHPSLRSATRKSSATSAGW